MSCLNCGSKVIHQNKTGPKRSKFCNSKCCYTYRNKLRSPGRTKICKACKDEFKDKSRANNCKICPECFPFRIDFYKYKISGEMSKYLRSIKKCMICSSTERLCIDHDHRSGKIRGVLCTVCNTALGSFKDDPEILKLAIIYLSEEL